MGGFLGTFHLGHQIRLTANNALSTGVREVMHCLTVLGVAIQSSGPKKCLCLLNMLYTDVRSTFGGGRELLTILSALWQGLLKSSCQQFDRCGP